METTDILESGVGKRVKEIILEKLEVKEEEIVPEAKFVDDLGADSLDLVEMVMSFENEYGIEISDEDAETLLTVEKAIDYIQRRLAEREQEPPNYSI